MKTPRWLLFAFLILCSVTQGFGQSTYCVRAGASGSNNGSDWNNAFSALPSTLVRGATYYIADGTYSGYTFDDAGTATITIRKATDAEHGPQTGWNAAYGDGAATFTGSLLFHANNYTLDGSARSGWRSGYGIRVDAVDPISIGIAFQQSNSGITIKYVEAEGSGNTTDAINDRGARVALGCSGLTFSYCWFHDFGETILHIFRSDDVLIENCVLERNHSTPAAHSEGIVLTEGCDRITIRNNILSDIEGTAYIATPTGGHPGINGAVQRDWFIYGNVFVKPPNPQRSATGAGAIYVFDHQIEGSFIIMNNVFANLDNAYVGCESDPTSAGRSTNLTASNNLFWNNTKGGISTANITTPIVTHNAYFSHGGGSAGTSSFTASGDPFAGFTTGDYRLSPSIATSMPAGQSAAAPYNRDADGNTRGADGKWDRGAFEYTGSVGPFPPAIVTNPANATKAVGESVLFSVEVSGTAPFTYQWQRNGVNVSGATSSTYQIQSVSLADNGAAFRVMVGNTAGNVTSNAATLTVTSSPQNLSPSVSLTQPSNGATYGAPATITLSATASDSDGSIARVEFYNGQTKLGEDASAPYTWTWSNVAAGTYGLSARATDNLGALATSSTVNITIATTAGGFAIGDRVMVNIDPSLRVRSAPQLSATVVGNAPLRELGTIVGGPVVADGFTFYQVNYDTAVDGWSIQGDSSNPWLVPAPVPKPPTGLRVIPN